VVGSPDPTTGLDRRTPLQKLEDLRSVEEFQ
jgi:hypothetical protein